MNATFHLDCLRDEPPEPGPGKLVFILRLPLAVRGPAPGEITVMLEGEPLYVERVPCMRAALQAHLSGPLPQSAFRRGIIALLGFGPENYASGASADLEGTVDLYSKAICFVRLIDVETDETRQIEQGWLNLERSPCGFDAAGLQA